MPRFQRGLFSLSADPIHYGHVHIIRRAASQCGTLVVYVTDNDLKRGSYLFDITDRALMVERAIEIAAKEGVGFENIEIVAGNDLLVDVFLREGCDVVFRGVRDEAKAAGVVAKFLQGQQIEDFAKHRAFMTVGCDTGRIYQVTTRWSRLVGTKGVLYDKTLGRSICASNRDMPPSEEALSMMFAVETMEAEFLGMPG